MKSMKLPVFTLAALVLGILAGLALGPQAEVLGVFGKLVIQIIKSLAAPLLFFVIVEALLRAEPFGSKAAKLFGVLFINTCLAVLIGSGLSEWLKPGHLLRDTLGASPTATADLLAYSQKKIDWIQTVSEWIPKNPIQPFMEQSLMSLVILALAIGLAVRAHTKATETLLPFIDACLQALQTMITFVVRAVPLAVFGVAAQTVGKYGVNSITALGGYLTTGLLGLFIQILVVYTLWIAFFTRLRVRQVWKESSDALAHAFGVNSSLATLPLTLKTLDRLGVSKTSSRLGACVGTNFNNDGILLYEAMALFFVAQAHGLDLNFAQRFEAILACVIAGIGIAGVPEAGLISLALVLHTVGLPTEFLPFLLSVDWIMARMRSVTNVFADITVSAVLDGKASAEKPTRNNKRTAARG